MTRTKICENHLGKEEAWSREDSGFLINNEKKKKKNERGGGGGGGTGNESKR